MIMEKETVIFILAVFLVTTAAQKDYDVRLANQSKVGDVISGRIEVFYEKRWGTICDDLWDDYDAEVVCGMLGYQRDGSKAVQATKVSKGVYRAPFGEGSGPIWFYDVNCERGSDTLLRHCKNQFNATQRCTHSEDAGVRCIEKPNAGPAPTTTPKPTVVKPNKCDKTTNVRLRTIQGSQDGVGLVEVRRNDKTDWGQVCGDGWDVKDATVICRMLCMESKNPQPLASASYIGQPTAGSAIIASGLDCVGSEKVINKCPGIKWPGTCPSKKMASVTCVEPKFEDPEPDIVCDDLNMTVTFQRTKDPTLTMGDISPLLSADAKNDSDCTSISPYQVNADRDIALTFPYKCTTVDLTSDTHIKYLISVFYASRVSTNDVRYKYFRFNLRCIFPRTGIVDKGAVIPAIKTIEKSANGSYHFVMELFTDSTFSTAVTKFPWDVELGEWLNVGVILRNQYTGVKLVVDSCRATPAETGSSKKFDIIHKKCPGNQVTVFTETPRNRTTYKFNFQTFKFSNNEDNLYVECDTFVCEQSEDTNECKQKCLSRRRRDVMEQYHRRYTVHSGAIRIVQHKPEPAVSVSEDSLIRKTSLVETDEETVSRNLETRVKSSSWEVVEEDVDLLIKDATMSLSAKVLSVILPLLISFILSL